MAGGRQEVRGEGREGDGKGEGQGERGRERGGWGKGRGEEVEGVLNKTKRHTGTQRPILKVDDSKST